MLSGFDGDGIFSLFLFFLFHANPVSRMTTSFDRMEGVAPTALGGRQKCGRQDIKNCSIMGFKITAEKRRLRVAAKS